MRGNQAKRNIQISHCSRWTSLYNNIHPSKRLPSLSTSIVMIWFVMMAAGPTSTKNDNFFSQTITDKKVSASELNLNVGKQKKIAENGIRLQNRVNTLSTIESHKREIVKHNTSSENTNSIPTQNSSESVVTQSSRKIISEIRLADYSDINADVPTSRLILKKNSAEDNIHYELYATPSLLNQTNVAFGNNETGDEANTATDNNQKPYHLFKTREIEAGGAVLFDVTKSFRLKAGMQLNYANYTLEQSPVGINNSLFIANNTNKNNGNALTNAIYQLSIPLGTEWKLIGNGWVDWFAGATVQPTLMLSDPTFFQKTEEFTNADGNGVFRKWNVHSTLETFVNYHLTKNTSLKLGPQLRYQFMPSILPAYNVTERLYNVGLKLGFTGNF